MLSVLERDGLAEVGLERAKTDAARWGMATGATAKLHISMADFRNVTMFIVQVLKHVMAMLCEAKAAVLNCVVLYYTAVYCIVQCAVCCGGLCPQAEAFFALALVARIKRVRPTA